MKNTIPEAEVRESLLLASSQSQSVTAGTADLPTAPRRPPSEALINRLFHSTFVKESMKNSGWWRGSRFGAFFPFHLVNF